MTPELVTSYFTHSDGRFAFARWDRPLAPAIFGVSDESLPVIKGALETVAAIAGHCLTEVDRERGANFLVFFLRAWDELAPVPGLPDLIGDVPAHIARLNAADASQYRAFRFSDDGSLQACFTFIRMDASTEHLPAEVIALGLAVQGMLMWSDRAFAEASPLAALPDGGTIVRGEVANILRAAYDPAIPQASDDPALALRLYARASR